MSDIHGPVSDEHGTLDTTDDGFQMRTPLVLTTDVWPSRTDSDDPASPIEHWTMEHEINGYSAGFDYHPTRPDRETVAKCQKAVIVALRDAVTSQYADD